MSQEQIQLIIVAFTSALIPNVFSILSSFLFIFKNMKVENLIGLVSKEKSVARSTSTTLEAQLSVVNQKIEKFFDSLETKKVETAVELIRILDKFKQDIHLEFHEITKRVIRVEGVVNNLITPQPTPKEPYVTPEITFSEGE